MPTRVIDSMEKYKKLRKLNDEHRVKINISDNVIILNKNNLEIWLGINSTFRRRNKGLYCSN